MSVIPTVSSAFSPAFSPAFNKDVSAVDVYDPADWILATGFWDDTNIWVNSAVWID